MIEARGLAQLQIASELADCEDDLVLQSDGTSKNGQFYVLGMRGVGAGDAQSQLDLLKEIIGDLSNFGKKNC